MFTNRNDLHLCQALFNVDVVAVKVNIQQHYTVIMANIMQNTVACNVDPKNQISINQSINQSSLFVEHTEV